MNGRKFLLDTNVLIGLFEGRSEARDLAKRNGLKLEQCAVSQITRLELLGFAGLTPDKEADLKALLTKIAVLAIDPQVEAETIALRRSTKLKLPDAIIVGTAKAHRLTLLTLDVQLAREAARRKPKSK